MCASIPSRMEVQICPRNNQQTPWQYKSTLFQNFSDQRYENILTQALVNLRQNSNEHNEHHFQLHQSTRLRWKHQECKKEIFQQALTNILAGFQEPMKLEQWGYSILRAQCSTCKKKTKFVIYKRAMGTKQSSYKQQICHLDRFTATNAPSTQ